ncbi:hypothetical protein L207DRAFT_471706 [Hyaloscypha variabilis F]|uniref:BTB domain-containing protein n=1 Tax=Hyaloscypha variabilis (strain UAMH 11265 / GT02V1 / F) TaxID=1149755 RepID=A0A2J6QZJ0_HYAVF|nr:hypothetical protein L207DRAFT_471706 [Hyaloscypha variabilis F]
MSMMRQPSHTSSMASSTASPKPGRYSIFRKKTSISSSSIPREEQFSSDKVYEPSHSDKMLNPNSPLSMPDLEASRSNGLPSPDSFITATLDSEYQHLRQNIKRIRKAASDAKKVDAAWEVYKKLRDESLQQCRSLLAKSRKGLIAPRFYWGSGPFSEGQQLMDAENAARQESLDYASIGPLDTRSSHSGSGTEPAVPFHIYDQWIAAIREYKATQELMLKNLRNSLLDKYLEYEPKASEGDVEVFLSDKARRKNLIAQMRDTSVHRMKSEKHMFWDQYQIRSSDYEKLKTDLQAIEQLINPAGASEENTAVRECVIAKNGDTILEFRNAASENHPILRFRVSSHLLAEHSPLFAQFLSAQPGINPPFEMISQLPPPPTKHICKDGMEVKVYRMPQIELNKNESLKYLLHAAHMHKDRVPRQVSFQTFVNIAEVCLKYQCTGPLEMHVEYQWLPQWIGKLQDDEYDGFLVISYAFGLRRIFTRMSKTAILNAVDEEELRGKEAWPETVKEKIIATRAAKMAQIYECCTSALAEYLKTPAENTGRRNSVIGSLQLTTSPRCPRGSHQCDATNLGWLMLVYNELRILPNIMKNTTIDDLAKPPKRSLKELVACLGLMPSAPQVHSGVCDHAPLFRNAINDVYNSVTGLTLRDVSGKEGWALSKNSAPTGDHDDSMARDLIELEAPLESLNETTRATAMSNEEISFRILSHLDEMDDLTNAAMIDQSFYRAYKRNEATLLKNVINAERRRTMSQAHRDVAPIRRALKAEQSPNGLNISIPRVDEEPKSLATDQLKFPPAARPQSLYEDLYDATPPLSPSYEEITQEEHEEAYRIIWGEDTPVPQPPPKTNGQPKQPVERNDKCLVGDVAHTGDKARLMDEEGKYLREEQERELGQGRVKK